MPPDWIQKRTSPSEEVRYLEHPSILMLAEPLAVMAGTETATTIVFLRWEIGSWSLGGYPLWPLGPILILCTIGIVIIREIQRRATVYAVTDDTVFKKSEIYAHDIQTLPASDVDTVESSRTVFQRLFETGSIDVMTAGTDSVEQRWEYVPWPDEAASSIQDARRQPSSTAEPVRV